MWSLLVYFCHYKLRLKTNFSLVEQNLALE